MDALSTFSVIRNLSRLAAYLRGVAGSSAAAAGSFA